MNMQQFLQLSNKMGVRPEILYSRMRQQERDKQREMRQRQVTDLLRRYVKYQAQGQTQPVQNDKNNNKVVNKPKKKVINKVVDNKRVKSLQKLPRSQKSNIIKDVVNNYKKYSTIGSDVYNLIESSSAYGKPTGI